MTSVSSPNDNGNTERRYIHLGPTTTLPNIQQQIEDLQSQVRYLTSLQNQTQGAATTSTVTTAPPVISIVSREPVFPPPQPRIYSEKEKLRGRENYVTWRRMMTRELRMANLLPFVESPLGILTKWTEITRNQGDALAQKAILQAVNAHS